MKKMLIISTAFIALFLASTMFVSAGWFGSSLNRSITGFAVLAKAPNPPADSNVTEKVTCVFQRDQNVSDRNSLITCTSSLGQCSGTTSCTTTISGRSGTSVKWTACSKSRSTWLDGKNEAMKFNCKKLR